MNISHDPARRQLVAAATAALTLGWSATARAQSDFPHKPIRIIVPYSPGTGSDALARTVAQGISEKTGKQILVENRDGGGSLIGTQAVVKAAPDGYTLLIAANPMVIVPSQSSTPPYDPEKDLLPVAKVAVIPLVLAVTPGLNIKTVKELIAYAKANPGKLNYASSGEHTPHHLIAAMFAHRAGIDVVHVPFRGTAAAITAVLAHHTDFAVSGFSGVDEHIKAGTLRPLATTAKARNRASPDLPTIGETLPGYSGGSWWAMWMRAEVPQPIRDQVTAEVRAIIAEPEVIQKLRGTGLDPVGSTPSDLRTFLADEIAKLSNLPPAIIGKAPQ